MIEIYKVENGENLEQVRILWREFANLLKNRLHEYKDRPSFKEYMENYEDEVANRLPGRFGPPKGCLLLACYRSDMAGCVGLMDLWATEYVRCEGYTSDLNIENPASGKSSQKSSSNRGVIWAIIRCG